MKRNLLAIISVLLVLFSGIFIGYYKYIEYVCNQEYHDLDKSNLSEQNPDYEGWLYIADIVDLPVVQTDDNKYYLTHSFNKKESKFGCLFIDKDYNSDSNNLLIHGHNNNNSTMFSHLLDYKDEKFFTSHKEITFTTKDGEINTYEIIAVINYNVEDINIFNIYSTNLSDPLIERISQNSIYPITSLPTENNNFITLITCDTEYHGVNGRLIVIGYETHR